ncbi:MAG: hypothetical protein ABJI29_14725 [Alphaproteobacteria bacterium]
MREHFPGGCKISFQKLETANAVGYQRMEGKLTGELAEQGLRLEKSAFVLTYRGPHQGGLKDLRDIRKIGYEHDLVIEILSLRDAWRPYSPKPTAGKAISAAKPRVTRVISAA